MFEFFGEWKLGKSYSFKVGKIIFCSAMPQNYWKLNNLGYKGSKIVRKDI